MARTVNRHALDVLQLREALDLVAGYAVSAPGAAAVRALEPSDAPAWIEQELERVDETRRFLVRTGTALVPSIPDLKQAFRRIAVEGSSLEAVVLRDVAVLLTGAASARRAIEPESAAFPGLAAIAARLRTPRGLEGALRAAIDDGGEVKDNATRDLARLRREIRGTRGRLVQKLEKFMAALPGRVQVADSSVTVRDGRYVIPVRRDGRAEVGGLVHDESATGQTLFMEPPLAIEAMNRLRELEREEMREVQRILVQLTDSLRPHRAELQETLAALVELDSLYARARYAAAVDGHRPALVRRTWTEGADRRSASAATRAGYEIVNGRHPLLLATGKPVVPFDLGLGPDERVLLISGPNTGGKTVLLKAVGLLSALAQAGVIGPVGDGTRLPVFGDVFADIGDEQSIEASLSTFAAHLRNQREVLENAGAGTLVLMDEMGSGTDPVEGAALARSILVELVARGALTFATTHLGDLKALAADTPAVVNASLQFDDAELRPTYRLVKGVPGRSYGLAIARRLGLPDAVLERAETAMPQGERDLAALLDEMEEKDRRLQDALIAAEAARHEAESVRGGVEERERAVEARERNAERKARQDARALLLAAREEVESVIRELRAATAVDQRALDEKARASRRQLEEQAREQIARMPAPPEAHAGDPGALEVGSRVRFADTGAIGTLVELREDRAVVELGGLRMQVGADVLAPVAGEAPAAPARRGVWSTPDFDASPDVDLRGLRADEVAGMLQPAIDAAVQAALPSLRIIHGKGTGALRQVVAALLKEDRRILSFRPGGVGEGGAGVTVAKLS